MFFLFRPSREQLADWRRDKKLRPLRRAVSLATPEGRAIAAEYLGELADKEALSALSTALIKDKVASVRRASAQALGKLGTIGVSALSQALQKDPDTTVREAAAHSLGQSTSLEAVPVLEGAILADAKGVVRAACARALGQLKSERSVSLLRAALTAGHPLLTEGAAFALDCIAKGADLTGRERAAFLVGLGRFTEAADTDASIIDLLLLRAALSRDGSALPEGLLTAVCQIPSPQSVPFLGHRLLALRRVLSGGPPPEVYKRLQIEASQIEAALRKVGTKEAEEALAGYGA